MGGRLREIAIWAAEVRVFIYDILGLCHSAQPADQLADIFTKALMRAAFATLRAHIVAPAPTHIQSIKVMTT